MRGDEEPRSFYKAAIERVAQIDRRPFRIDVAEEPNVLSQSIGAPVALRCVS
jgi:hypothetical protein